jgi:hypothetical protein
MRFILALFLCSAQLTFAADIIHVDASGRHGLSGRNGIDYSYSRGFDGISGSPGFRGGDGSRGRDGGDAGDAANGYPGGRLQARLQNHPEKSGFAILSVTINGEQLSDREVNVAGGDRIILSANGGRGGQGGKGGGGEEGGRGGKGGDANEWNNRSGDGGRGGDGGNAGRSTDGGNGGDGGEILLLLPTGQEELARVVSMEASGGAAGAYPIGRPNAGRGGQGGEPGNHCYFNSNGYQCGFQGMRGFSGMDGRPAFSNPRPGYSGQQGRVEIRSF